MQALRHVVVPHVNGAHVVVVGAGQLPAPLQDAAAVATPAPQLAVRHEVAEPGKVHEVRVVPLQLP